MLIEVIDIKNTKYFENKMSAKNVTMFYSLAKLFHISCLGETTLKYIKRCYTMVVETKNFLELSFELITKILSSSELNIHSELEVFNVANRWLEYKLEERKKYAKSLLLTVRFPVLSANSLKCMLNEILRDKMLKNKENFFKNKSSIYYTNRYCDQEKYDPIICCGFEEDCCIDMANSFNRSQKYNSNKIKLIPTLNRKRYSSHAVCIKGELYLFGGFDDCRNLVTAIRKYSFDTKTWFKVAEMADDRIDYSACAFTDSIFVFGGVKKGDGNAWNALNTCLQFGTTNKKWKLIPRMAEEREYSACCVFNGMIIVCGGINNDRDTINSVESYDVIAEMWSSMPEMVKSRRHHSLVVARKKLFVVDTLRGDFEVFEATCNKFVILRQEIKYIEYSEVISIGGRILIFYRLTPSMVCYDVDKNEWIEESCETTKDLQGFSCVKVPKY